MRQDFIKITNLNIFAHHGVLDFEKQNGQNFYVNAKLYLDLLAAAKKDDLTKSVHYGEVCQCLTDFLTEHTYDLIETAAYEAAKEVLLRFPLINQIDIELCKPEAPIGLPFENVSVNMSLGWHDVFIALGSNMGEKERYISQAVEKLKNNVGFKDVTCSSFIITKPYGGVKQDDFVNGMLRAKTLLRPLELLDYLHELEEEAHRERIIHWGPRTLDLDIIYYDDEVIDTEELCVPHVDMCNRDFVLKPLVELAPNKRHPISYKTSQEMLAMINRQA